MKRLLYSMLGVLLLLAAGVMVGRVLWMESKPEPEFDLLSVPGVRVLGSGENAIVVERTFYYPREFDFIPKLRPSGTKHIR